MSTSWQGDIILSTMFSSVWTRGWGAVALVLIVTVINVVAFFGALRVGYAFYQFPAETEQLLHMATYDHRNSSAGLLPAAAAIEHVDSSSSHDSAAEVYSVCLFLIIGDDTNRPDDQALPYSLLYRLLDVAKAELSKVLKAQKGQGVRNSAHHSSTDDGQLKLKLLVGVDYPSVVCKMVRDTLQEAEPEFQGVEVTCGTPGNVTNHPLVDSSNSSRKEGSKFGCGTAIVGKSARHVAQLSVEWAQLIRWEDLRVVDLDVPDTSHNPPALPRKLWRPTVITTFSSNHFAVGLLLLRSLGKAGMEAATVHQYNISVVVFTLEDFNSTLQGLLNCVVLELNEKFKVPTEVRRFDFSANPSWMRINQTTGNPGEYAWKVVMVHSVIVERGFVLWTDAGCRYSLNGLIESLNYTRDNGFASKLTPGAVPKYVHPGQIKYLRYQVRYGPEKLNNCDGSGIGFTLDKYEAIVRPWYDCGTTRQCIAPDGSSRANHRHEQAALTLLSDMAGTPCRGISGRVRRHMDYRPLDYSGTYPTQCYRDPLQVVV